MKLLKKLFVFSIIVFSFLVVHASGDITVSSNNIAMKKGETSSFTINWENVIVKNASGEIITEGNTALGTGSKIIVNDNEYTIIIDGDINKDAKKIFTWLYSN